MQVVIRVVLAAAILFGFIKRADICAMFGKMAYAKGNTEKAFKWFERASKIGDMNFANKLMHAYIVLRDGDFDRAYKMLTLISLEPINAQQRMKLKSTQALCDWKMGNIDSAIERYEEVIEKAPATSEYGSLGYLYLLKGDLDTALDFNLKAYDYNADDPVILDNLANTYLQRQEYEKAEEYYQKVFAMQPTFPDCYFAYGKYLVEKEEVEEGKKYLKRALDCNFSTFSTVARKEILQYMEIHALNEPSA